MAKRKGTRKIRTRKGTRVAKKKDVRGYHDLECRVDGCYSALIVPKDAVSVMCSTCLAALCEPPPVRREANPAKAQLRKIKRNFASEGINTADLPSFPKGWHRRKHFKIKVGKKTYYFASGRPVSRKEFTESKKLAKREIAKSAPHSGYGRGWHLKKEFIAPDGTVFSYGKEVKS